MEGRKTTQEECQKCMNAVVDYVNLHLDEEIDLKSLTRTSHFSPFYFHRIMKAFLDGPVGTFIAWIRIETAVHLLCYSSAPIADIAYRIGYASPSSFSRIFKQMYSISPTEYRNNKSFVIMKPAIIKPDLELKKEIRELPQRNAIYIRPFDDYKLDNYAGTWIRLIQFVREQKLSMGDPSPLCIYHDDPKVTPAGKLRAGVCVLLPTGATPKGNVGFRQLPAGCYTTFLYQGPYDQSQAVYDTIYGKYPSGMECVLGDEPSAERYLNDPSCAPPEELLAEIYIPVE